MIRFIGLLCLAVGVAGCGPAKPPVAAVTGKVTVKGAPAVGALVVFHPTAVGQENAAKPSATVGDDGTYTLGTFEANDGALPGEYAVTIVWNQKAKDSKFSFGDGGGPTPDKLGNKYGDPRNTPLRKTVTAAGPNAINFELD